MHLANEDDENFFCLSFQTIPETSNGVAHILEHTVLCGSEKFPIRDPFFSMNRRSLNTFMNAFTGADFTCYPAATQVPQDFYNLLEVYLDAVFHPRLERLSFLQEGHRLEFDEKKKIGIKGIVYNEMKGALSSAESRLGEALMESLFPELTYGVNSGGDPKQIPNLTHEELKAFHSKFYHPSRALFFFYGNLPLEKHLEFIEKHALSNVLPVEPLPRLGKQTRFKEKKRRTLSYPISKDEEIKDKNFLAFGFLTTSILDQEEILALQVIDLVLMGTDAAPLKLALLKSQLCKQAESSLEDELSEVPFFIICKGCQDGSADALEKVLFDSLEKIASAPLSEKLVEGAIHQLEIARKEISVPYGLVLFFRSALLTQHGGNPEDGLKIHTLFKELRQKVKDPEYLTKLIRKHFLANPHYVRLEMVPDPDLQDKEQKEEEDLVASLQSKLNASDLKRIEKEATALEKLQEKEESLDVLPKISLKDVSLQGKEFPLKKEALQGGITLYSHTCFTNEILYADLVFDLPEISKEDLPYLKLFSLFLPQVGCGGRDYRANLDYLFEHTGGLSVDLDFGTLAIDPHLAKPALVIRGKALYRKADKLFPQILDLIVSPDFSDKERMKELLGQHHQEMEHSVQASPLRYAMQMAVSGMSLPLQARNLLHGLDYYKRLCSIIQEDISTTIAKLEELKKRCLLLRGADLILGCDDQMLDSLKKEKFFGLTNLALQDFQPWKGIGSVTNVVSQGRKTATSVAFTSLAFPTFPYTDPRSPSLSIASKIMENKVLHKRIREQGGAYGSGSANVPMSGYFYFYSYRDPHLESTRKAFQEAAVSIAKGQFDEDDLDEAKLGILQDLDSPLSPGHRAFAAYERLRYGRTPERRQEYRVKLLASSKKENQQVAKDVILPGLEKGVLVSFGPEEILKEMDLPIYPVSQ